MSAVRWLLWRLLWRWRMPRPGSLRLTLTRPAVLPAQVLQPARDAPKVLARLAARLATQQAAQQAAQLVLGGFLLRRLRRVRGLTVWSWSPSRSRMAVPTCGWRRVLGRPERVHPRRRRGALGRVYVEPGVASVSSILTQSDLVYKKTRENRARGRT